MPITALLLALAAAAVHATWNLLLSNEDDVHSSTAVAVAVGVLVFAPVAALTWRMHTAAIPYIAASSALESLYLVLLATAYTVAAVSFVYPIARGSAPVLVLIIGVVALGTAVSVGAAIGVVVVAVGILLVRGVRASGRRRDLALALSVGVCIAGYTLVDKRGITHANPIAYLEIVFACVSVAYLFGVWKLRGTAALRAAWTPRSALAGIGYFGGYALTLAALTLAPAAAVAAVRESSVVMATGWLAITGREEVSRARMVGAVAVAAGIALVSLS
jgi:drug/metabolite transporter (DMT)-like permease